MSKSGKLACLQVYEITAAEEKMRERSRLRGGPPFSARSAACGIANAAEPAHKHRTAFWLATRCMAATPWVCRAIKLWLTRVASPRQAIRPKLYAPAAVDNMGTLPSIAAPPDFAPHPHITLRASAPVPAARIVLLSLRLALLLEHADAVWRETGACHAGASGLARAGALQSGGGRWRRRRREAKQARLRPPQRLRAALGRGWKPPARCLPPLVGRSAPQRPPADPARPALQSRRGSLPWHCAALRCPAISLQDFHEIYRPRSSSFLVSAPLMAPTTVRASLRTLSPA